MKDAALLDTPSITIVIPVYNEQDALDALLAEIRDVAGQHDWDWQVIFVNDGSTDGSWRKIQQYAEDDERVGGLRLRTNSGKAAALMAGFTAAQGQLVFMMDADGQDPPKEMQRFIEAIDSGFDVVSGWKKVRHDPWHKVYPSRVFNKIIGWLTHVHLHDHVCGFKCMRRPVVRDLQLHGGWHRFIGVLAASMGYRVTEIPTLHRARTTGRSKYGFSRFAKGFIDMLSVCLMTRYKWRPQHLIGVTGLWLVLINLVLLAIGRWLPSTSAICIALLGVLVPGVLLIAIGLVADMIVAQRDPHEQYAIAERIGWCADEPRTPAPRITT